MKINVNFYSLSPRRFIAGTKGSYGTQKLKFAFDTHWRGLTKKVIFYPMDATPVEVDIGDEPITIPREVMSHEGLVKYTVMGVGSDRTIVSVTGGMDVLASSFDALENEEYVDAGDYA